jgi:hypothetical protein
MKNNATLEDQIRHTIRRNIEKEMPLRLLKRIVYEVRCEEMGVNPDSWNLYADDADRG